MTLGQDEPSGLRGQPEHQETTEEAKEIGSRRSIPIGPSLPPCLRRRIDSPDEDAKRASSSSPAERPWPVIGPPLPPGLSARATAPEAPTIGPPLSLAGSDCGNEVVTSRKRDWDRVLARESSSSAPTTGKQSAPAHPGDEGREEWMTVPPVVDRNATMLAARGFSSGKDIAGASGDSRRGPQPPSLHSDAIYEVAAPRDGEDANRGGARNERGDSDAEDDVEAVERKRPRVRDGGSLLEQHRAKAKREEGRGAGQPRHRQFDREKEFTNHKTRDASFYASKSGGLFSRYATSRKGGD
jgi:Protein of unknown function (DUF3752)